VQKRLGSLDALHRVEPVGRHGEPLIDGFIGDAKSGFTSRTASASSLGM
jgi:hypothetical protein